MSDKVFIGQRASDLDIGEKKTISKVVLYRSKDTFFEAGDDTGGTLELTNPWATQEMAERILAEIKGSPTYVPFDAVDALLDPAAEIGDTVTVGGVYSEIVSMDIDLNVASCVGLSAPGVDEIEDEYPYKSTSNREIERENKRIYSLITKTDEAIRLYVADEIKGVNTSITQTAEAINLRVDGLSNSYSEIDQTVNGLKVTISGDPDVEGDTGLAGKVSTIELTLDGLTITVEDEQGQSTTLIDGGSIYADDLYVNAANITGVLTAGQLQGNEISFFVDEAPSSSQKRKAGYISLYYDEFSDLYEVVLHSAGALDLDVAPSQNIQISCNALTPSPDGTVDLGLSRRRFNDIYAVNGTIQTSDLNQKTDIGDIPEAYLRMLDGIAPKRFKLIDGTSGRYHIGFIAQDVEQAMSSNGVPSSDFAGLVKSKGEDGQEIYMLRYTEFIPLLLAKIKQLEQRMEGTA